MNDIDYEELIEKFRDYKAGTFKTMSLKEKMDFFDGVHTEKVAICDEEGDDMNTLQDFWDIEDEFLNNPQLFSLNDILSLHQGGLGSMVIRIAATRRVESIILMKYCGSNNNK